MPKEFKTADRIYRLQDGTLATEVPQGQSASLAYAAGSEVANADDQAVIKKLSTKDAGPAPENKDASRSGVEDKDAKVAVLVEGRSHEELVALAAEEGATHAPKANKTEIATEIIKARAAGGGGSD